MKTKIDIKEIVKHRYSEIAKQDKAKNSSSCCGSGGCSDEVYNIMTDDYTNLQGYNPDADLSLGCGLPTLFAKIKKGDIVVDLGSGAGNDCFVARAETGDTGKVIGIDFIDEMISRAKLNAENLGYTNVEFLKGDIEKIPLQNSLADVVVSNCVLNLVPDKNAVFSEIFRILKNGGHFSISDIVLEGNLPEKILNTAEMYVGCVAGALQKTEYLNFITKNGFKNLTIQKEKKITVPDDILLNYLSKEEIKDYNNSGAGVYSITVYAEKH